MSSDSPFAPEQTAVRVRALLLHTGLSKKSFGETLSLSPSQVTHLITAHYAPSPAITLRMIRAFGVTSDWLHYDDAASFRDAELRNALLAQMPQAQREYRADMARKRSQSSS